MLSMFVTVGCEVFFVHVSVLFQLHHVIAAFFAKVPVIVGIHLLIPPVLFFAAYRLCVGRTTDL